MDVFYVAEDLKVKKESKYKLNGINYFLIPIVQEDGDFKICQVSLAPVDIITSLGVGFGTNDEKQLATFYKQRAQGKYLNHKGEVIETNNDSSKINSNVISPMSTADHTKPSTISVYLTNPQNQLYYGGLTHVDVDFYFYVLHVLPFEWDNSYLATALNVGAECVKMYGWYNVYYPVYTNINADVYDNTNSQVFQGYTDLTPFSNCTNAINNMGGIGLQTSQTGSIFLPSYRTGDFNSNGYHAGIVYIKGSQTLAQSGAYNYLGILSYYYNSSSTVNGENVGTFSYAQ